MANTANILIAGVHGPLTQAFVRYKLPTQTRVTGSLLLKLEHPSLHYSEWLSKQQSEEAGNKQKSLPTQVTPSCLCQYLPLCSINLDVHLNRNQYLLNGKGMRN